MAYYFTLGTVLNSHTVFLCERKGSNRTMSKDFLIKLTSVNETKIQYKLHVPTWKIWAWIKYFLQSCLSATMEFWYFPSLSHTAKALNTVWNEVLLYHKWYQCHFILPLLEFGNTSIVRLWSYWYQKPCLYWRKLFIQLCFLLCFNFQLCSCHLSHIWAVEDQDDFKFSHKQHATVQTSRIGIMLFPYRAIKPFIKITCP